MGGSSNLPMKLPILFALVISTLSTVGQVLNFQTAKGVSIAAGNRYKGGSLLRGTSIVDPIAHTVAISGEIVSPGDSVWAAGIERTIIVPGEFPNVDSVFQDLNVAFSFEPFTWQFSNATAVPESVGGFSYVVPFTDDAKITLTVNFTYELFEDGVLTQSGSGSYLVEGAPTAVQLNVAPYPNDLFVNLDFDLLPIDPSPIIELNPAVGSTLRIDPLMVVIPEQTTVGIVACLGLLGLVVARRSGRFLK